MDYILLIIITLSSIYFATHVGLIIGIKLLSNGNNTSLPFVSVIVAARNEEATIGKLLNCLLSQSYPNYEIIIIDDRSDDRTSEIVKSFQANSKIKLIKINELNPQMPAKKNALMHGISASKGEILCFTDADCFPQQNWISTLVKHFDSNIGIVAGFSPYIFPQNACNIFNKIFYHFILYEEYRAAIWSSGSIGLNAGWLCTGRNFAYRKCVYEEIDGFESIKHSISGDDDLFLQSARRKTKWKISYVLDGDNFVPTVAPATFNNFLNQRTRHFSATKYFTLRMKIFFILYHLSNACFYLLPLLFFLQTISLSAMLALFLLKCSADYLLISYAKNKITYNNYSVTFVFWEFCYCAYNILIGPLGFIKKFNWKK